MPGAHHDALAACRALVATMFPRLRPARQAVGVLYRLLRKVALLCTKNRHPTSSTSLGEISSSAQKPDSLLLLTAEESCPPLQEEQTAYFIGF